jgi:hypothetical protein
MRLFYFLKSYHFVINGRQTLDLPEINADFAATLKKSAFL